jgi:hypothetical protein
VQKVLRRGEPEASLFATCPETGVTLKCKLDWKTPDETWDLKTFTAKRGVSVDKAVHDAMFYEGYLRQAWFYNYVRTLAQPGYKGPFVFAFVESEPPHEVRIKKLVPGGDLYWIQAGIEVRGLIRLYADCVERWGEKPWREERSVEKLADEDIKQLAYA